MITHRCGAFVCTENRFKFLLGVNYWPRKLNIRMWKDWDEEAIREDCRKMRELGIRVARVFLKDEDFSDEDANVYKESLGKLVKFLDILAEHEIQAFITFIVGHMSGKNWRIPWTSFDELYTAKSIERTSRFVKSIVNELKDHRGVAGWILSNELSLVKRASSREEALSLLKAFAQTIKSIDKNHVLSSGDVPDSFMQETYNVRDIVDYVGPHLYLYDSDTVRHAYLYVTLMELFSNAHTHPVIVEEFGFSTHQFSEESQAQFINEMLYTSLAHEASGAFIWCFSDFEHESDPPYNWRPLELGFGIIRPDGSEKKSAKVIKRFSQELAKLEELGINIGYKRHVEAYIVAPFYLWRDYEFVWYKDALGFFGIIRPIAASYMLLSSVGAASGVVYELDIDIVKDKAKLVVMPSVILALASTWRKLFEFLEKGINVYSSFVRGVERFMALHEAPTHLWLDLFGVENTLAAGSVGRKLHGEIRIEFAKEFGSIKPGQEILIEVPVPVYLYKARPVDAEVIAYDSYGEPVLFVARRGRAKTYLSLIPIEVVLAYVEEVKLSSGVDKIYEAIAVESQISRPYVAVDPRIEIQVFTYEDKDIIIAINHSYNEIATEVRATKRIANVQKIGGDAELIEWDFSAIKLRFGCKSAITLLVERS